jgi:hypothetical protein
MSKLFLDFDDFEKFRRLMDLLAEKNMVTARSSVSVETEDGGLAGAMQVMLRAMEEAFGPENERKCVLCGELYRRCKCRCTGCGAMKWTALKGTWHHHVCNFYQTAGRLK